MKDGSPRLLEGGVAGNTSNWRKAEFVREFTPGEQRLVNGGSVWNFEYDQGSFEVVSGRAWILDSACRHAARHRLLDNS